MTSENTFPNWFTKIDDLMRDRHHYLMPDDECYFIGEYTADTGYWYSPTNNLISNLKKGMDRRELPEWRYKRRAIVQAATAFRRALSHLSDAEIGGIMFVPAPPSKAIGDPDYDDRLLRMLNAVRRDPSLDIRDVVVQTESTEADHTSGVRRTPEQIAALYVVDEKSTQPIPSTIAIVDDRLTNGAHFKAMCSTLKPHFPSTPMAGLFLARRVPPPDDFLSDFV